ncbi:magnesium transporter [Ruminococcus sp.]|uniref:magnesium transporter n=1 Tax=Ruminococcus sp. TaxID=41978 RepID=UPI003AF98DC7
MFNTVLELLKSRNYKAIREIFMDMNEADVAALLQQFYDDHEVEKYELPLLFRLLNKDVAADVFAYMDSDTQMMLINAFTDKELQEIVDDLYLDDTVDIIEEMPANVVARIVKSADAETRKQINQILKYPKDSAGSIMTTEYVYLHRSYTAKEALDWIRHVGMVKETVNTLYVTENRKLVGVLSLLDIVTADDNDKIEDIMEDNVISVDTLEDKEYVASMFSKYDFLSLPVVDRENRMVGIVTFDDAMDVIQDENTEDFSKMAAIAPNEESYFRTGIFKHAKSRIVWLLILMISATITQIITNRYEAAFAAVPLLVSFMPMIMDTGGNCGAQSSTLIIRGIALDEIHFSDFFKVVFKEFRISIIVSSVLAVVNGVRIYIMYQHKCDYPFMLALTIALSIIATVILSKVIGSMLPMLAKKCRLDPAIMATPLITTIVDCCSLFLYFNIATIVFSHIGIL